MIAMTASGLVLVAMSSLHVLAPASASESDLAQTPKEGPATQESIEAGRILFQRSCAVCHGPGGKGGLKIGSATASDLTDEHWDHGSTDADIFNTIRNGVAPAYAMPPFEAQLSDMKIRSVIDYLRTLRHPSSQASVDTESRL
jgi:cbb3-type cytochrome c oxidase subunit III